MKIHIAYNLKSGPWGGGNQFLKALQKTLIASGDYSELVSKYTDLGQFLARIEKV